MSEPQSTIPFFDADQIRGATPWPRLIEAIAQGFVSTHHAPDRHIHDLAVPGEVDATALLMPAWIEGEIYGVKLATIFPSNNKAGARAVNAIYVLFDGMNGKPLALMDGGEITARRTAATSALAARYLAREDARTLLVVGTGRLPPLLAQAHKAVRDIDTVLVWGRNGEKAEKLAQRIGAELDVETGAVKDLEVGVRQADIVSCATISREALVLGDWLEPGTHLDLVGAFTPLMRETDAKAVTRSAVFIDTLGGAKAEAGDLIHAINEAAFGWDDVVADLPALCSGAHKGRSSADEITLFKSVGAAIEDLVAARLTYKASTPTG
ncbi:ornithine cyclodeaminase [Pelagibacterium lentulum]|uniref:Ornithine cyclodeaminase n=1 Tax=Pelagibacterium lentulum TaxID=2029865 RepID=A0A916VUE3_9HYPH|nr:ornithine cyclodeaminase [Pelagibacterium lentulum]